MRRKNGNVKVIRNRNNNLGMFIFLFVVAFAVVMIPAGLAAYAEGVSQDLASDEAEISAVDSVIEEGVIQEDPLVINETDIIEDPAVINEEAESEINPTAYYLRLCLYDGELDPDAAPNVFKPAGSVAMKTVGKVTLDTPKFDNLTIKIENDGTYNELTCKSSFSINDIKDINFKYVFTIKFFGDGQELGNVQVSRDCTFKKQECRDFTLGSTGQIYSTSTGDFRSKTGFLFEGAPLTQYCYMAYKISCVNTYSLMCNNDYVAQGAGKGTIEFTHNLQGIW